MNDDLILKELKELIEEGIFFLRSSHDYKDRMRLREKWIGSSKNLLVIRFGRDSVFYKDFIICIPTRTSLDIYDGISPAIGVLEYVHNALEKGLTEDLYYKKEILLLTDIYKQANEFLEKGFKLAAGVYGRIILETTIKEFAKKKNIDIENEKFDRIIIKLRQDEIITKPFENSLRANYEIGSWAAHGDDKFNNQSNNAIKEFLTFIRDKVLTLN